MVTAKFLPNVVMLSKECGHAVLCVWFWLCWNVCCVASRGDEGCFITVGRSFDYLSLYV